MIDKDHKFKFSVMIPTYNRRDSLRRLLEGMTQQSFKDFEVIIVDAGSNDGTEELVDSFRDKILVKFIRQEKGGFVEAVNIGWRHSEGEIFIRTDDDVSVGSDWLQALLDGFVLGSDIGGVTGPVVTPDSHLKNRDSFLFHKKFKNGSLFWKLIGKLYFDYFMEGKAFDVACDFKCGAFSFGSSYENSKNLKGIFAVDHHESANMAVRLDLLKKVGGFDDIYTATSEYCDSDVSYKICKLGKRIVYNPKAAIYHYVSKKGFYSKRDSSYHRIENFIRFYFRHIKPDTLDKVIRFIFYLCFLNGYFFYTFLTTKKIETLGSFPSTVINLVKYSLKNLIKKGV